MVRAAMKHPEYPTSYFEEELEALKDPRLKTSRPSWGRIRRIIREEKLFIKDDRTKQPKYPLDREHIYSDYFLRSAERHCGIVIPTEGRPAMLRECLETIEENSIPNIPVLIVDDSAKKPVADLSFIRDRKSRFSFPIRVIRNDSGERRGAGWGRKIGQDYWLKRKKHLVFQLDDDAFIRPNCLENLYAHFLVTYPKTGIIGAIGSYRQWHKGSWDRVYRVASIGVCYMVPLDVVKVVGNFDSRMRARQDMDLEIRVQLNEFPVGYLPRADVNHVRYRTKKEPSAKRRAMFDKWRVEAAELMYKKFKKYGFKLYDDGRVSYLPEFKKRGYVK